MVQNCPRRIAWIWGLEENAGAESINLCTEISDLPILVNSPIPPPPKIVPDLSLSVPYPNILFSRECNTIIDFNIHIHICVSYICMYIYLLYIIFTYIIYI